MKIKMVVKSILIASVIFIAACTQEKSVSNEVEIVTENDGIIYTMPDYNRIGIKEEQFNGNQSQAGMTNDSYDYNLEVKKRLETVLDSIKFYKKNETYYSEAEKEQFYLQLEKTQKLWDEYELSMLELKFPSNIDGGSSQGMCINSYLTTLKENRIRVLNQWLMGGPQGDVCSGTTRMLDYSLSAISRSEEILQQKKQNGQSTPN